MMFTTERISNGYFAVYWNGRRTAYSIFNGDLGNSGRGNNIYGISLPNSNDAIWIGTLQAAKKHCKKWVTDAAKKGNLDWF